jgi:hypothetical protein
LVASGKQIQLLVSKDDFDVFKIASPEDDFKTDPTYLESLFWLD